MTYQLPRRQMPNAPRWESAPAPVADVEALVRVAVENERWRLKRELTEAIERIPTHTSSGRYYDSTDRRISDYRSDVLARIKEAS